MSILLFLLIHVNDKMELDINGKYILSFTDDTGVLFFKDDNCSEVEMKGNLELPRVNERYLNSRLSLQNYKSVFIPFCLI